MLKALLDTPQVAIWFVPGLRNRRSDCPSPVNSPMPELSHCGDVPPSTCTDCGVVPFITHTATDVGLRSRMSSPAAPLNCPVPSIRYPAGTEPSDIWPANAPVLLVSQRKPDPAGKSLWNKMSERLSLPKLPYRALLWSTSTTALSWYVPRYESIKASASR